MFESRPRRGGPHYLSFHIQILSPLKRTCCYPILLHCDSTRWGSTIRLRLQIEQLGIPPIQCDQFSMGTALYDTAVLNHKNAVGEAYGAEAVADEDGGLALGQRAEVGEDLV